MTKYFHLNHSVLIRCSFFPHYCQELFRFVCCQVTSLFISYWNLLGVNQKFLIHCQKLSSLEKITKHMVLWLWKLVFCVSHESVTLLETFSQMWPFRWCKYCRVVSVSTCVADVSKVCTFHPSSSIGHVLIVWCLSPDQPPPFKAAISWLELSRLAGMLVQAQGMHRCFGCLCCAQDISNFSSSKTLSGTVVFHTQLLNNAVHALVWLLWQSL